MHPVLIQWGDFRLPAFGVMVALAFVCAFIWIVRRARQIGESPETYLEACSWFVIAAIVGARLLYIVFFPDAFWADPLGVIFNQAGLVWYGGMLGVLVAGAWFAKARGLRVRRLIDVIAPPAALGLAIGRIGCLLAGCCYGSPCALPWAIRYPHSHPTGGMLVHPAPVYESFAMLGVAGLLAWLDRRKKFDGETSAWFLVAYGVVRFLTEMIRGDRLIWFAPLDLSASQAISLVGLVIGLAWLVLGRLALCRPPGPVQDSP